MRSFFLCFNSNEKIVTRACGKMTANVLCYFFFILKIMKTLYNIFKIGLPLLMSITFAYVIETEGFHFIPFVMMIVMLATSFVFYIYRNEESS